MDELIRQIESALTDRPYPGDENITYCTYDKKNGDQFDGPCPECREMSDHFRAKSWRQLHATDLRRYGQADAQFTIKAYCYLLPAYLIASLRQPDKLDVCVDHLTYRFGPEPDYAFGQNQMQATMAELRKAELSAALAYFRYALSRDGNFDGFGQRATENIERELSARPN